MGKLAWASADKATVDEPQHRNVSPSLWWRKIAHKQCLDGGEASCVNHLPLYAVDCIEVARGSVVQSRGSVLYIAKKLAFVQLFFTNLQQQMLHL